MRKEAQVRTAESEASHREWAMSISRSIAQEAALRPSRTGQPWSATLGVPI